MSKKDNFNNSIRYDMDENEHGPYKVIVLFPDGKSVFIPYDKNDDGSRKVDEYEYTHKRYILKALELGGINLDEKKLKSFSTPELYIWLMENDISFFCDIGKTDSKGDHIDSEKKKLLFYKSFCLSEEEKRVISYMERIYPEDKYEFAINTLKKDDKIIDNDKDNWTKFRVLAGADFNAIVTREYDFFSLKDLFNILEIQKNRDLDNQKNIFGYELDDDL